MAEQFSFSPELFYAGPDDDYPWTAGERELESRRLQLYPELRHWSVAAFKSAWGWYSQDIFAVGWVDWIEGRDEAFLAYIYISQLAPKFNFGGTGLFDQEIEEYSRLRPWEGDVPLPVWTRGKV